MMISTFIFAAVIVAASSEVVQYHKDIECSVKGPEFWCRNEDTAKQCLATNYCSEHVWAKKQPKADYCTTCEQYVGIVHSLLANNDTQAEILAAMKSMCAMLPTSIQSTCTQYVSQYGEEVMELLVQYTADSKQFCTMIGLCSSTTNLNEPAHVRILKNLMIQQGSTDYCLTCEQYVGTIHLFISNNATQEQLINGLKSACSLLPASVSSECTALMTLYAPQIVQWLVEYTGKPSQFCTTIGLCQGQMGAKLLVRSQPARDVLKISMEPAFIKKTVPAIKSISPASGTSCELCTVAMSYLEGILKEKSTAATVKSALDQLCTYLPKNLNDECKLLVSEYSDQIITLLVDELKDTSEVCKELGLCSSAKKVLLSKKRVNANPITCEVCEYAIGYLASMLQGNTTEAAVQQALDELCGELPESMSAECTSLVNQYTDTIIKFIVTELKDPAELCKELGLCSTAFKAVKKNMPNNPITCELCEVAIGYLENMLKGNTTEAAIKNALDNLCALLPTKFESECDSFVDQYAEQIIQLLVSELADPATLCKELGLCTSSLKTFKVASPASAVGCEMCTWAMGKLDSMLKDKATVDEIKSALGSLCSDLPASLSGECKSLVDTYGDAIISMLVQEMDPTTICEALKLCTGEKKLLGNRKYALAMRMSLKGVSCGVCKYAMGYLDGLLESKTGEAEVEAAVEKLCSYLPDTFKNECDALITEYGDDLIKLVVQQIQPATVCQELKLC